MLRRLADFGGEAGIGVYDPDGKLKPMLTRAGVPNSDLDVSDNAAGFQGQVVILRPIAGQIPPAEWKSVARKLASRGIGVVVLLPRSRANPLPEVLREGRVIMAQGVKWDDLENSAPAQFALLHLVELAVEKVSP